MKFQAPPGMRDFYPEQQRLQNWLFDHWKHVSQAFGFQEYEGPIFESLELYEAKSGEGLVGELFRFEDQGGRRFAIRPEMTPTLARMVAAQANSLPRPIKWYSIPRMCRAERPQRGRLREFFQWNVDILGIDDPLADAETIAVAAAFLERVDLTPEEVQVNISSRAVATQLLSALGVTPDLHDAALKLLDRREKLSADEFAKQWTTNLGSAADPERVVAALEVDQLEQLGELLKLDPNQAAPINETDSGPGVSDLENPGRAAVTQLQQLFQHLTALGVAAYCKLDLGTVRGLAYYTGPVFEVRPTTLALRALLGGGRYDNLTEVLGGPKVTGVGFGVGDAPILACLEDLGKLPVIEHEIDVFVIDASEEFFPTVLEFVGNLRSHELQTDFSYKRQKLVKQLKQASQRHARYAVIVGQEYAERQAVVIKDLTSGTQSEARASALRDKPLETLAACGC